MGGVSGVNGCDGRPSFSRTVFQQMQKRETTRESVRQTSRLYCSNFRFAFNLTSVTSYTAQSKARRWAHRIYCESATSVSNSICHAVALRHRPSFTHSVLLLSPSASLPLHLAHAPSGVRLHAIRWYAYRPQFDVAFKNEYPLSDTKWRFISISGAKMTTNNAAAVAAHSPWRRQTNNGRRRRRP
jgi:hypothetical protein